LAPGEKMVRKLQMIENGEEVSDDEVAIHPSYSFALDKIGTRKNDGSQAANDPKLVNLS